MFFSKALLVLASASLLQFTTAASNEGVYLANCNEFEAGKYYSEMDSSVHVTARFNQVEDQLFEGKLPCPESNDQT